MSKQVSEMVRGKWLHGALLMLCVSAAQAGLPNACGTSGSKSCVAPVQGEGSQNTTQAFAGINWAFGDGPELVVGVRSVRVNERHRVEGARVEATFPFSANAIAFDKLRVRLIGGHRKGMYELGGGYAFGRSQGFLLSGALKADHVVAGTDFMTGSSQWQPFVGIDTLDRLKNGALACADAGTLTTVDDATVANNNAPLLPGVQLNGYTCLLN